MSGKMGKYFKYILMAPVLWLSVASASDRDWGVVQRSKGGLMVLHDDRPVMRLNSTLNFGCKERQLLGNGYPKGDPLNALERYYATAKSGDVVGHLANFEDDGTLESAKRNIKTVSDLKESFRNVVDARCIYALELPSGAALYRVVQRIALPNNPAVSFEQNLSFLEYCDASKKCKLSARFLRSQGVEAMLTILDPAVLQTRWERNIDLPAASTSLSGSFLLKKTSRKHDFGVELFLEKDQGALDMFKGIKFSFDEKNAPPVLFLSELSKPPVLQHRDVALKDVPLNSPIERVDVLRLSSSLKLNKPIALVSIQSVNGSARRFVSLNCLTKPCSVDGYVDEVVWNLLASIQFR